MRHLTFKDIPQLPFRLINKAPQRVLSKEELQELIHWILEFHRIACGLNSSLYTLEVENARLKAENGFMLRLINEKKLGE